MKSAIRHHEHTKKVYACPECWGIVEQWTIEKYKCYVCTNGAGQKIFNKRDLIIFGSSVEWAYGFKVLKQLEKAGKIQDLQHYEVFELWPNERVGGKGETCQQLFLNGKFFDYGHDITSPYLIIEIPHKFNQYESDFSYIVPGETKRTVIECKGIRNKKQIKKIKDAKTGKIFKTEIKIPWPYFPGDFAQFKLKCKLMWLIHKIRVRVQAENRLFLFDEKWRLKEVNV